MPDVGILMSYARASPTTNRNIAISRKMSGKRPLVFHGILEASYSKNRYPSKEEKILLSQKSGKTFEQVDNWFSNRRAREKVDIGTIA
jgi:hypothetical protein